MNRSRTSFGQLAAQLADGRNSDVNEPVLLVDFGANPLGSLMNAAGDLRVQWRTGQEVRDDGFLIIAQSGVGQGLALRCIHGFIVTDGGEYVTVEWDGTGEASPCFAEFTDGGDADVQDAVLCPN